MKRPLTLAVLISGNGSNLQAIIDAIEDGRIEARIALVVSNLPGAYGLERACRHGLTTRIIDHRDFADRDTYDAELAAALDAVEPDFIVLAGFMRILGAALVARYEHRILNIHPSLLPAYKGLDTYQRALDHGESRHGVSIHLVTARLDDGPVLLQGSYPIDEHDDPERMAQKGHALEHRMYPALIGWLAEGRLTIHEGQACYDQQPLQAPIQFPA